MRRLGLVLLVLGAACVELAGEYRCATDANCRRAGVPGTCEPIGYCAFPDAACASGQRYADAVSGLQSGVCVGEERPDGDLGFGDAGGDVDGALSDGGAGDGPGGGGMLTLLAGQLGGDGTIDGIGGAARFFGPRGLGLASDGNLYVADTENHVIRKVVPATGQVTTVAGAARKSGTTDGVGAAARFERPIGLAADAAGNLYVGDHLNFAVRKVAIATGAVTTIAGTGAQGAGDGPAASATFTGPAGVALDGAGNLYLADQDGSLIRKLDLVGGQVSTVAGGANLSGTTDDVGTLARFNSPAGVAFAGGALYVADRGNHTIRKIVLSTAAVTTFAGTAGVTGFMNGTGTATRFTYPTDLVSDGAGNLFVADQYSHCVRKIVIATAAVSTFAGTCGSSGSSDGAVGAAHFDLPGGIASDGAGKLYVTVSTHGVRQIAGGQVTTLAGLAPHAGSADLAGGSASFDTPQQVVFDGAGRVYVSDAGSGRIRAVELATGQTTTLATGFGSPRGLALDGAGALYVADAGSHVVDKVTIANGQVVAIAGLAGQPGAMNGTGSAARFQSPMGLALGPLGQLYVADAGNATMRQIDVGTGAVTTLAGTAGMPGTVDATGAAARFDQLTDLAVDPGGTALFATQGNHLVRRVALADGATTTFAGAAGTFGAVDGDRLTARFRAPAALAFDGPGRLYVADTGNHLARAIDLATGQVSTVLGVATHAGVQLGALPGQLNGPAGLAAAPGGLVVTSSVENAVLRWQ